MSSYAGNESKVGAPDPGEQSISAEESRCFKDAVSNLLPVAEPEIKEGLRFHKSDSPTYNVHLIARASYQICDGFLVHCLEDNGSLSAEVVTETEFDPTTVCRTSFLHSIGATDEKFYLCSIDYYDLFSGDPTLLPPPHESSDNPWGLDLDRITEETKVADALGELSFTSNRYDEIMDALALCTPENRIA